MLGANFTSSNFDFLLRCMNCPLCKIRTKTIVIETTCHLYSKKKKQKNHMPSMIRCICTYLQLSFFRKCQMVEDGIIFPMGHGYPGRGKEPYAH